MVDLIVLMNLNPDHLNNYYLEIGIDIKHYVAHTLIQNGLAKSFIKFLNFITRQLIWFEIAFL